MWFQIEDADWKWEHKAWAKGRVQSESETKRETDSKREIESKSEIESELSESKRETESEIKKVKGRLRVRREWNMEY